MIANLSRFDLGGAGLPVIPEFSKHAPKLQGGHGQGQGQGQGCGHGHGYGHDGQEEIQPWQGPVQYGVEVLCADYPLRPPSSVFRIPHSTGVRACSSASSPCNECIHCVGMPNTHPISFLCLCFPLLLSSPNTSIVDIHLFHILPHSLIILSPQRIRDTCTSKVDRRVLCFVVPLEAEKEEEKGGKIERGSRLIVDSRLRRRWHRGCP